jgi:hypothetical protein
MYFFFWKGFSPTPPTHQIQLGQQLSTESFLTPYPTEQLFSNRSFEDGNGQSISYTSKHLLTSIFKLADMAEFP